MNNFCRCPRCGDFGFEWLETYGHCVGCLYFVDSHFDMETSYHEARAAERLLEEEESEASDCDESLAS